LATDIEWAEGFGETFRKNHASLTGARKIDCGLAVSGASFDIFEGDGIYTTGPKDNALVFFLFRLLQKLQSLGTVPAICWNAYAKQLSTPK
jgi:hypothetical protein